MSSQHDPSGEEKPPTLTVGVEGIAPPTNMPKTPEGIRQKEMARKLMGITDNFEDVGFFHAKFDLPHSLSDVGPKGVDPELLMFRAKFLQEEFWEFLEAVNLVDGEDGEIHALPSPETYRRVGIDPPKIDHAKAFDALLDLVYVAMGTAHLMGYPWAEGWARVQNANMAKVRAKKDGSDSLRGSSFDVVKPEGWQPPDIEGLLQDYGWDCQL